jgi:hypothetical protein
MINFENYPNSEVVLRLATAWQNGPEMFYGPFASTAEAVRWMREQPGVRFNFVFLRSPWRSRPEPMDFYYNLDEEDYYPDEGVF